MLKNIYYNSENSLKNEKNTNLSSLCDNILSNHDFSLEESDLESALEIVRISVELFIQSNFTGCIPTLMRVEECLGTVGWITDIDARKNLMIDGEELDVNVTFPGLLLLASRTLDKCPPDQLVVLVWRLRVLKLHQQVLDDLTGSLYHKFQSVADQIRVKIDTVACDEEGALLLLEIAQGYIIFRRVKHSKEFMDLSKEKLEINVETTSLLGMRTRWQTKPLPQMLLRIKSGGDKSFPDASGTHGGSILPKLLQLDDDTRLEKIKFLNEEEASIDKLPSVVQCLIAVELHWLEISQPKDNLAEEELQPYIVTLLQQDNGPWCVRITALLANINIEGKNRRTVDRSLKQCEEILKLLRADESSREDFRLLNFFQSGMMPMWQTEIQLGSLMISLGLVKTALDVYLRIQAWDEVISCYTRIELRHKAEEIIRQELEKCPTVKLYCLLGDATDDPQWYEKAWDFSNHRSGRAQRHWGNYFFARKEYSLAIPHFQQSLQINSLQESLWLRLGFAALEVEEWSTAANAYQRYTHLETNVFEAWNNMAKAYVKMGDKMRAHRVLTEALKCNYDMWKVWENFMVVSLDTGHFDDVVNAYGRLLELRTRYEDRQVLDILTASIENHIPDHRGDDSHRLVDRAGKLLAQLCIQHGREGFYWEMAARVTTDKLSKGQKLLKAFTGYTQTNSGWHEDPSMRKKLIVTCLEVSRLSLISLEEMKEDNRTLVISQLASARLAAQNCLRKIPEDPETEAERTELTGNLQIITDHLKILTK
ncbi:tetratricopeptide repeat protein 27 [Sergentomyia squamirostris]